MMTAGFIHFDCVCGLDIYYFGDLATGQPPHAAIDAFQARLSNHQHAIFTSQDDAIVPCPHCDSLIQLPTPQVAEFLAQMSLAKNNQVAETRSVPENSGRYDPKPRSDDYNLQLPQLN